MERGEIWWAELPAPRGSEPGYSRPVLIIQADHINRRRINTIVCVALTANLRLAEISESILLRAGTTGLRTDSVANMTQLVTVDRAYLIRRMEDCPARSRESGCRAS